MNNESGAGNRLHYNLVEVFGFNEIRDNLDTYREYPELASFFLKLEDICIRHNIPYQHGIWIEYHHSDFFKADNQIGQPPKRKNSKFFKICQTLKTDYRVRKFPESEQKTVRYIYFGPPRKTYFFRFVLKMSHRIVFHSRTLCHNRIINTLHITFHKIMHLTI